MTYGVFGLKSQDPVQYLSRLPCPYLGQHVSVHLRPFSLLLILPGISRDWLIYFFLFVTQVSQLAKSPESAGFILSIFSKHYYITQNNQSHQVRPARCKWDDSLLIKNSNNLHILKNNKIVGFSYVLC